MFQDRRNSTINVNFKWQVSNLMEFKPESVTLEINVVMPGKGTIELSELTVSDFQRHVTGEWFSARMSNIIFGGVFGAFWGIYGALCGVLAGTLIPRGRGYRLVIGMLVFGLIMGVLQLVIGVTALLCGQPYHVWYPFLCGGGVLAFVFGMVFIAKPEIRKHYEQAQLRKMQALDACSDYGQDRLN